MERMSNFTNKHKKIFLFIIALGILLSIMLFFFKTINNYTNSPKIVHKVSDDGSLIYSTSTLYPGTVIEQNFELPADSYEALEMNFATFARENFGEISVAFVCNDFTQDWRVDCSEILDNSFHTFTFDKSLTLKKNETVILTIKSKAETDESCPTISCIRFRLPTVLTAWPRIAEETEGLCNVVVSWLKYDNR